MAEYATSWQSAAHFEQPKNVHFEPFVRGLLIFLIGTKSVSEGGGVQRLMTNVKKSIFWDLSHNIYFNAIIAAIYF